MLQNKKTFLRCEYLLRKRSLVKLLSASNMVTYARQVKDLKLTKKYSIAFLHQVVIV